SKRSVSVKVLRTMIFFFLSSRRRHTRCYRDWSSDVCSSDLLSRMTHPDFPEPVGVFRAVERPTFEAQVTDQIEGAIGAKGPGKRSEERRVGKECRARRERDHWNNKRTQ